MSKLNGLATNQHLSRQKVGGSRTVEYLKMLLDEDLAPLFRKAGAIYAYLFGSRARGEEHLKSDTDIAVWLPEHLDVMERFQTGCVLQVALEKAVGTAVDLVILNDAKPILQHEAVMRGNPIYTQGSLESRLRFESTIRGRYEDYAYSQRFFTATRRARMGNS